MGTENDLLVLIPLLPALGALVNLVIGHVLQRRGLKLWTSHIAVGVMLAATGLAWYLFLGELIGLPEEQRLLTDHVWTMFQAGSLSVDFGFALDPLSMTMVLIITTIGTGIHIYSVGYMADDPGYWKFFLYLNYFVFSMLLLVMGDNFVLMFFGWEGVGLASYLLIGFWYTDVEKAKAAMKAFVVNRFGDFGFILGLFLLFWALGGSFGDGRWTADPEAAAMRHESPAPVVEVSGQEIPVGPTMNFRDLRNQVVLEETVVAETLKGMTLWGAPVLFLICAFMFIGAAGKSAQIPLYVWLPDAMAGPTPVSALIHAATMVTAGVYMVARLNFLYAMSPGAMTLVACFGAATALFAATIGFFQHDIKKVLAYSTVSQLGFMFIGVGIGAFWVGIFHLLTHACFKACLFLGSGSVIHGCHHEQDMRKMGGLKKYMPITHWTYLVACMAITGVFVFNGFYSKDEILWLSLNAEHLLVPGWLIWGVGLVAALGTSYYMWRSYWFTFHGEYRGGDDHGHGEEGHHAHTPHESPWSMTGVLIFLAVACFGTGLFLFMPHVWGIHLGQFDQWLAPVMAGAAPYVTFGAFADAHALEIGLQVFGGMALPALGAGVAWYLYVGKGKAITERLAAGTGWYQPVYRLIYDKYRVDELYDATIIRGSLALSRIAAWFDTYVIDGTVNLVGYVGRTVMEIVGAVDQLGLDAFIVGSGRALMSAGEGLKKVQSRSVHTYLYTVLGGALVIVLVNYVLFKG